MGGNTYNTCTTEPFEDLGLDSQRVNLLPSSICTLLIMLLKMSIPDIPLSTFIRRWFQVKPATLHTIINFHQEMVSGQACNPPYQPISTFIRRWFQVKPATLLILVDNYSSSLWRISLWHPVQVTPFPLLVWGVFFPCLLYPFIALLHATTFRGADT